MGMKKTAAIGVRVDPQVKRAAENAALDDHRSVASLVEKLLIQHLREFGYLNGKTPVRASDEAAAEEAVAATRASSRAQDAHTSASR